MTLDKRLMNEPQIVDFSTIVSMIRKEDSRYSGKAYDFMRRALDYTLKRAGRAEEASTTHVSSKELLSGIRDFALDQFGPMTVTVLNDWGIHRCEDFGDIVFNLVDYGVLGRSAEDNRDDFKGGYSFKKAFIEPFQPAKVVSKPSHKKK